MAVCLATTTGDTVDDDHVVELVREDDEVCLLDSAVITSYSPLTFHLQLNARSAETSLYRISLPSKQINQWSLTSVSISMKILWLHHVKHGDHMAVLK